MFLEFKLIFMKFLSDINECADGSYACSSNKSRCFNTEGSYKCCNECWILGADGQNCNGKYKLLFF